MSRPPFSAQSRPSVQRSRSRSTRLAARRRLLRWDQTAGYTTPYSTVPVRTAPRTRANVLCSAAVKQAAKIVPAAVGSIKRARDGRAD
jgi:hypothetical protein